MSLPISATITQTAVSSGWKRYPRPKDSYAEVIRHGESLRTAASLIAGGLIGLAGGDPWLTLAPVYLATALLTTLATNNVAAFASFATPFGYQTNLMVYNLGGYRFSGSLRVGVPLTFLVGLVTIAVVPRVWELRG